MTQAANVRITAAAALLPQVGVFAPSSLNSPSNSEELDLISRLGRKGQRYNTRATLLAMAAVAETVEAHCLDKIRLGNSYGLVAASCYGNLSTVCGVAEQLTSGGVESISPMQLPNASTNILASQTAIKFGITGPCLTIDDGHRSGDSLLRWAGQLLAVGRCRSVIAVASESPSQYESKLRGGKPLIDGAIALFIESSPVSAGAIKQSAELPAWCDDFELASLRGLIAALHGSEVTKP